jgi:hypothetical protein
VPAHGSFLLSLLQEPPQIELADRGRGGLKPFPEFHLLAYQVGQPRGDVEGFGLAIDQHRELELRMEAPAIGAVTGGLPALAVSLDEGAGEHVA